MTRPTTRELSIEDARRIAVAAQGLNRGPSRRPSTATQSLTSLGAIQIDSMSAVRKSHELVLLARGVPLQQATALGTDVLPGKSFEGLAHALSLIPVQLWPAFSFRREQILRNGWRGPDVDQAAVRQVKHRLETEGPLQLRDFGTMNGTGWERSSPYRWALEWLAATGEAVCAQRQGWRRIYAPTSSVIPRALRDVRMSETECLSALCLKALEALGIATTADVADYFRVPGPAAASVLVDSGLEQVKVEGWTGTAWISPAAETYPGPDPHSVTPLSPFDSLVWTRGRQQRLFAKNYLLEAYKPVPKRTFGYFAMPILQGSRIVGRIALRRKSSRLIVENAELDAGVPITVLDEAIQTVATWTESTLDSMIAG